MEYQTIEKKRYLTVKETAMYLGISTSSLYNKVAPKAKKPFPVKAKRIGKSVRFDRQELDQFMEGL